MNGVYRPWSAVHDEIIAEVRTLIAQHPDYTLESTGHSLGGALTYMSYIALAQNFPDKDIRSNALAAFPIGNQEFADFGEAQPGTLIRGNNINDGVPVRLFLVSSLRGSRYRWNGLLTENRICISPSHGTLSTMEL